MIQENERKGFIHSFKKRWLDQQTAPNPQDRLFLVSDHPASGIVMETPLEDLAQFIAAHPEMLPPEKGKTTLRLLPNSVVEEGKKCYLHNASRLQKRAARNRYITFLNENITRDTGLLGLLGQLLEAQQNQDRNRCQVYRGYVLELVNRLNRLAEQVDVPVFPDRRCEVPSDPVELRLALEQQLKQLAGAEPSSEFEPLYLAVVHAIGSGSSDDWPDQVRSALRKCVREMDPELHEAILEEFPLLGSVLV